MGSASRVTVWGHAGDASQAHSISASGGEARPEGRFEVPDGCADVVCGQDTLNRLLPVEPVGLGVCLAATASRNNFMIIPPAGHESGILTS